LQAGDRTADFARKFLLESGRLDSVGDFVGETLPGAHHGFHELTVIFETRKDACQFVPVEQIVIDATVEASEHVAQEVIHVADFTLRNQKKLAEPNVNLVIDETSEREG